MTNIFLSVLEVSASMGLIAAVMILLSPFLNRRYAAKWKYWIWIFLALRLLLPFSGTDLQSAAELLFQTKTQSAAEAGKSHAVVPEGAAPGRVIIEIPEQMTAPIAVQSEKGKSGISLLDIAAMIWLSGSLLFILVHFISYLHYKRRMVKRGLAIEDSYILHLLLKLKRELHIKCNVLVMEAPEAASPMLIGFFHPVLIMPEGRYSSEEIYFILKHELVHLKRKDVWFKLLFVAANAVHWFNPLIWLMQRVAVVDMELSCDERVTQGGDYALRKAYTETLLATLHKQCKKKTVLSTQFYGGKQIMKKRFQNILNKKRKKNGFSILLCAVILTIALGTLAGCSLIKENIGENLLNTEDTNNTDDTRGIENTEGNTEDETSRLEQMAGRWMIDFDVTEPTLWGTGRSAGNEMEISATGEFRYYIGIGVGGTGQCEEENGEVTVEIIPFEEHSSEKEILTLNYVNENGEEFILMDWHGENVYWKREGTSADVNSTANTFSTDNNTSENTMLLTFSKEGETEQKQAILMVGEGYSIYLPDNEWQLTEPDTWTAVRNEKVRLRTALFEGKSAAQVEEELSADGYGESENHEMLKQEADMVYKVSLSEFDNDVWGVFYCYPAEAEEGWGRELPVIADTFAVSIDFGEIETIVNEFAAAYFEGAPDTVRKFLVSAYEWDVTTYEGTGTISDLTVKGLADISKQNSGNGQYTVSLEFRDSDFADTFQYVTITFVREDGDWKIQFYGLEG